MVQRTPKLLALALLLLLSLTLACATPSPPPSSKATAYKTLKTLHDAYSNTFNALGEAYKQGKITDAQRDQAVAYGRDFVRCYNLAVDALAVGSDDSATSTKPIHNRLNLCYHAFQKPLHSS